MSRSCRTPCFILAFLCSLCCFAQNKIYHIDFKKDGLLLGGGLALWSGSQWMKSNAARPSSLDISQLNSYNVWSVDRGAINNFSVRADHMSDVFFALQCLNVIAHHIDRLAVHINGMLKSTGIIRISRIS